jgi:Uma2 family endonuclease
MVTGQDTLLRWTAPDGPWREPDLHLFPQDGHRYEIIDGALHVTPPLDSLHERIVYGLSTALRNAAPAGWWACSRLGVQINESHVVPDIAVLRPESSGATWNRPADIALVVEVESPATQRYDRLLKPALYADAGIPAYWRVERHEDRAVAHLYSLDDDGAYGLDETVEPGQRFSVAEPYAVAIAPTAWA